MVAAITAEVHKSEERTQQVKKKQEGNLFSWQALRCKGCKTAAREAKCVFVFLAKLKHLS